MDARVWLRDNGYDDIADMIDEIMREWKDDGKKTRRNWWDILAGGKKGQQVTVAGRRFPVLKAAQIRQGMPVTKASIRKKRNEHAPPVQVQERWRDRSNE